MIREEGPGVDIDIRREASTSHFSLTRDSYLDHDSSHAVVLCSSQDSQRKYVSLLMWTAAKKMPNGIFHLISVTKERRTIDLLGDTLQGYTVNDQRKLVGKNGFIVDSVSTDSLL